MREQRQRKGKKRQSIVDFETPTRPTRSVDRAIHLCQPRRRKRKTRGNASANETKSNQTHLSQRSRHEPRFTLGPNALLHVYHASRQLHIASSSSVHSSVIRFRRVVNPKRDHPFESSSSSSSSSSLTHTYRVRNIFDDHNRRRLFILRLPFRGVDVHRRHDGFEKSASEVWFEAPRFKVESALMVLRSHGFVT